MAYPVVYLTVSDRVVDAISRPRGGRQRFISNEEIEVLGSPLRMQMAAGTSTSSQEGGLVRDGRTAGSRAASTACRGLGSYRGGEHEGGRVITGEPLNCQLYVSP